MNLLLGSMSYMQVFNKVNTGLSPVLLMITYDEIYAVPILIGDLNATRPRMPRKINAPIIKKLISFPFIIGAFIFLGMRGRVAFKSPIRIGTAYISSYAII